MRPPSVRNREACELFLHESLELCQYLEEGLLLLTNGSSLAQLPRLLRSLDIIKVGAEQLAFPDIHLVVVTLQEILRTGETASAGNVLDKATLSLVELLSEQLRFILILAGYQVVIAGTVAPEQAELIQQFLLPKSLTALQQALSLQHQQLRHQIWSAQLQLWCSWSLVLNDADGGAIATATLQSLEAFPEALPATGNLAVTALKIALKQIPSHVTPPPQSAETENRVPQHSGTAAPQPVPSFYTRDHFLWITEGHVFYIPSESIVEIVVPQNLDIHPIGTQSYLHWNNQDIPLYDSTSLILDPNITLPMGDNGPILVLQQNDQYLALALEIEHLVMESELRLESPPPGISPDPAIMGWTRIQDALMPLINVSLWLQSQTELGFSHSSNTSAQQASSTKGSVILVVDDSRAIREKVSLTLQNADYQVLQARDGQEALRCLAQHPNVRLVMSDIEMGNLNGFEFLRNRLQNPQIAHIPVIILSSHTSPEYRQLAQKLGAVAYLNLPYEPKSLLKTIATILDA
jgi:chemotaxis family two-component system sensor histidine kinase/response regulator PixL